MRAENNAKDQTHLNFISGSAARLPSDAEAENRSWLKLAEPRMSIIIVNWNTRDILADCLESILADIGLPEAAGMEVYVVDNASADESVAMLRNRFPWVKLIENTVNVGFARANNQAIRICKSDYLLLLNSDTKVLPGALQALVKFMDETPQAGAAGSLLLNPDQTLQHSCYRVPTLFGEAWRLLHLDSLYRIVLYDMKSWSQERVRQVEVIQGASFVVRRQVVETVGMFDEDYFMYTEEVDWCDRILQAGWKIFWVPQSKVIHYGGQSTRQAAQSMFLRLYESKIIFFRKHRGALATLSYKLVLGIASLLRLAASPIVLLESGVKRQEHLRTANNYYHLLRSLPNF